MKEINNPITLSCVRMCVYEANDEIASAKPGIELFDGRRDFLANASLSGVAVLIMLTNERRLTTQRTTGIRRYVKVVLIDETVNSILDSKNVWVNMCGYDLTRQYRVDFPLCYATINTDHSYKFIVRDECSCRILGEERFRLYEEFRHGKNVSGCFSVKSGAVVDIYGGKYKSLECFDDAYYKLLFDLQPCFDEMPVILPEFEVCIYSPDGRVVSRFCHPVRDEDESGMFHLETPFLTSCYNRGVCYAEIRCMDYPIAGMVFATDYDVCGGQWEGGDLKCLEEYSLDAATERFHLAMGVKVASSGEDTEDEDIFDKALQEFIDSQMDDKPESEDGEIQVDVAEDLADDITARRESETPATERVEQSILMSLNRLTGLTSVKEKLSTYEKVVRFNKMRSDNNLPVNSLPLHAMFLGSPGTGKTTVAKMMGVMLRRAGMLSKGHVVVKERATLLGPNYSMEETNTLTAIEEARGGILLIDEAYQLCQLNDSRDPGKFVIETLMTALADESSRDWMLILAGYPDEMKRMFEMNPGLKSRIPDSNIYVFEDFSESELMEIAEQYFERNNYILSSAAHEALLKRLADDYSNRDKNFGNARHVINMIQTEILPAMAIRVVSEGNISPDMLSVIQPSDIPNPVRLPQTRRPRIGYCA